jgi:hypothetical protein
VLAIDEQLTVSMVSGGETAEAVGNRDLRRMSTQLKQGVNEGSSPIVFNSTANC